MANRIEQYKAVAQLGVLGACEHGYFETSNEETGPGAVEAQLHIVHKGSLATYTPTEADNGAYMVFDYEGDMEVTLPLTWQATELNPFSMMMVNTLGRIDFVISDESKFIGFAPHADRFVTVGLIRGEINWYATGTNNKLELS